MNKPSKAVQKMLDKAARNAKAIVTAKMTKLQKEREIVKNSNKYGIYGTPKGQPVNIHRGRFQRKYSEEDWATDHGRRSPPVLSLDNNTRLRDLTRS